MTNTINIRLLKKQGSRMFHPVTLEDSYENTFQSCLSGNLSKIQINFHSKIALSKKIKYNVTVKIITLFILYELNFFSELSRIRKW